MKKKLNILMAAVFAFISLAGYNSQSVAAAAESMDVSLNKTIDFYGITFGVSTDWNLLLNTPVMKEYGVFADNPSLIVSVKKGSLDTFINKGEIAGKSDADLLYMLCQNLLDNHYAAEDITLAATTVNGKNFIRGFDYQNQSRTKFYMYVYNGALYIFAMDTDAQNADFMNNVLASVAGSAGINNKPYNIPGEQSSAQNAAKPINNSKAESLETPQQTQQAPLTSGQMAVERAKKYLENGAYSRYDLYQWLKRAGFANPDAAYGTANSGANWNEQALKKANQYLESMPFSKEAMAATLEKLGFSSAEAAYAAANSAAY